VRHYTSSFGSRYFRIAAAAATVIIFFPQHRTRRIEGLSGKGLIMRRVSLLLVFTGALANARITSADVSFSYRFMGIPMSGPYSAPGYFGFVIHLHSDSGNIWGVDFSGTRGFQGQMVQRWLASNHDGDYDTPTPGFATEQNLTNSPANFDSHFLGLNANHNVASALFEDAVISPASTQPPAGPPPNTDEAGIGLGTFLKGAYGILPAAQSPDLDVAYIVCNSDVTWSAQVGTSGGVFDINSIGFPIPEPATITLAVCASVAALRRRLRR
jgi:hypothetical protein